MRKNYLIAIAASVNECRWPDFSKPALSWCATERANGEAKRNKKRKKRERKKEDKQHEKEPNWNGETRVKKRSGKKVRRCRRLKNDVVTFWKENRQGEVGWMAGRKKWLKEIKKDVTNKRRLIECLTDFRTLAAAAAAPLFAAIKPVFFTIDPGPGQVDGGTRRCRETIHTQIKKNKENVFF